MTYPLVNPMRVCKRGQHITAATCHNPLIIDPPDYRRTGTVKSAVFPADMSAFRRDTLKEL